MPVIFSVGEGMDEGRKGLPRTRNMMPNIVLIYMHICICLCGMCIIIFPPKFKLICYPIINLIRESRARNRERETVREETKRKCKGKEKEIKRNREEERGGKDGEGKGREKE